MVFDVNTEVAKQDSDLDIVGTNQVLTMDNLKEANDELSQVNKFQSSGLMRKCVIPLVIVVVAGLIIACVFLFKR
jgi:t-SNARE complex subunit (syntaxin)